MNTEFVLLSLGSNIGDRKQYLDFACALLENKHIITDIERSSFYETEPFGVKEQDKFVNIAIKGYTSLSAPTLLEECKKIEQELGRQKRERWHEREIDIDIIFYGDKIYKDESLIVPHVMMDKRRFVLVPAAEISGEKVHPIAHKSIDQLLHECQDDCQVKKIDL